MFIHFRLIKIKWNFNILKLIIITCKSLVTSDGNLVNERLSEPDRD
jgi:hypothetical protein